MLVIDFDTGGAITLEERVFLQDLEELLLASNYQLLSAGSELAASLPSRCVAWRIDIDLHQYGDLELGKVELRSLGEVVETWQEQGSPDWVQLALRQRLAAQLVNNLEPAGNVSRSLHDPLSEGYRDRIEAMRLFAEGQQGKAADVLRMGVARDGQDAALRFLLGRVLLAWADGLRAAAALPSRDLGQSPQDLALEALRLLNEAEAQLERSLELDASSALARFARGKVRVALGRRVPAAADFAAALETWPAYGEAAHELARLHLDSGEMAGILPRIEAALSLIDQRKSALRAELFFDLGESSLRSGNPRRAVEALRQALAEVPAERRAFRLEALSLLAEGQTQLGDEAAACATRRDYQTLGLGGVAPGSEELISLATACGECCP